MQRQLLGGLGGRWAGDAEAGAVVQHDGALQRDFVGLGNRRAFGIRAQHVPALAAQIQVGGAFGTLVWQPDGLHPAPRRRIPPFKTEMDISTPCLSNLLGVKGVGELDTIGATPSVVNAVADALARGGKAEQAKALQMPLLPGRLWAPMQG
jgi:hypothetical protein